MPPSPAAPARPLPRGLILLGSAALACHLCAVGLLVLAAPSGPWPTSFGTSMALEPQFALTLGNPVTRHYLMPLKMSHNYHFATNRPGVPRAFFEVRLKDEAGKPIKTVRLPDARANFWVRHRQGLLAQWLADDRPVQARPGEAIAPPDQEVRRVEIWDTAPDRTLRLRAVPEHLVPRDRAVMRPSQWSLVLARSYVRYLCREHGAASGELIRHTREPVLPAVLFLDEPPADAFEELISNFGELSP
jgi:hypothetical protein